MSSASSGLDYKRSLTAILAVLVVAMLMLLIVVILQVVQYATASPPAGPTGPTGGFNPLLPTILPGPNATGQYGDGRDGDVVYSNGTFTFSKDMYFRTVVFNNATVNTNGFRMFAQESWTCTGSNVFLANGSNGQTNEVVQPPSQGGAGAPAGTLGGGGAGGNGYFQFSNQSAGNGQAVRSVVWGTDTTRFSGADGVTSAQTVTWPSGKAGAIHNLAQISAYELAQALNPSFVPVLPLLNGGSGGGGGQGSLSLPGSGGGGGGGVILVSSAQVICDTGSCIFNVGGGNGGVLGGEGPFNATSGGGGGGGFVVINTQSPVSTYNGINMNLGGGSYIDASGNSQQSSAGLYLNYVHPEVGISFFNPQQQLICTSTGTTPAPKNMYFQIPVPNVSSAFGIFYNPSTNTVTVNEAGTYLITFNAPTNASVPSFSSWVRVNNVDAPFYGQVSALQDISVAVQIALNAGDFFDLRAWQNTATNYIVTGANLSQLIVLNVLLVKPAS